MIEMMKWYAVKESRSDGWDKGSYNYREAVQMLWKQGDGLIVVVNEQTGDIDEEIEYSQLF